MGTDPTVCAAMAESTASPSPGRSRRRLRCRDARMQQVRALPLDRQDRARPCRSAAASKASSVSSRL